MLRWMYCEKFKYVALHRAVARAAQRVNHNSNKDCMNNATSDQCKKDQDSSYWAWAGLFGTPRSQPY
eukprot:scaffold1157_cov122-Cylindrotheca_fusiformis.AAC.18